MSRGFVVLAQNTEKINYVKCAEALAVSIKRIMPNESITLITDNTVINSVFDNVVKLPYGDLAPNSDWKLINDWQIYEASPYEYTIKLEADMFIPANISHWWEILKTREIFVCSTIRNFKQEISNVRAYRKFIDENKLPDVYNAITYFKKSEIAEKFFNIVKDVFTNWKEYKSILQCNPNEEITTDWAYAIATLIIGKENVIIPNLNSISMVHMKQFINNAPTEKWTDTFVHELLPDTLRINTCPQLYPLHYHVKEFSDTILEKYQWKK